MGAGTMENKNREKKKRITSLFILLFVLISTSLILIEVGTNVSTHLLVTTELINLEETVLPPVNVRPTYPPDYTPPPIMDTQP
jgi:hypothetical protein